MVPEVRPEADRVKGALRALADVSAHAGQWPTELWHRARSSHPVLRV